MNEVNSKRRVDSHGDIAATKQSQDLSPVSAAQSPGLASRSSRRGQDCEGGAEKCGWDYTPGRDEG